MNRFYSLPDEIQNRIKRAALFAEFKEKQAIKYMVPQNKVILADAYLLLDRWFKHDKWFKYDWFKYNTLPDRFMKPYILHNESTDFDNISDNSTISRNYFNFVYQLYNSINSKESLYEFCSQYKIAVEDKRTFDYNYDYQYNSTCICSAMTSVRYFLTKYLDLTFHAQASYYRMPRIHIRINSKGDLQDKCRENGITFRPRMSKTALVRLLLKT